MQSSSIGNLLSDVNHVIRIINLIIINLFKIGIRRDCKVRRATSKDGAVAQDSPFGDKCYAFKLSRVMLPVVA